MKKRMVLFSAAAAVVFVAGVASLYFYIGRAGTSDLETWIGRQVAGILQSHINPQVRFDNLDYQSPRTVVIDNLSMTDKGHSIVQIARARLELAEIPRRGKPILIQDIQLTDPKFQFITTGNGDLIGWSHFVKKEAVTHPETVPQGQRLSDTLVLKRVGITNGEIVYEGEADGRDRMTLPGIDLNLDTPHDEHEPAWHVISGQLKRDPIVDLQLRGRINLDTGLLEIAKLQLAASLSEQQYTTLPPALQNFLRRHEVQGALNASAQGKLPLKNPAEFAGDVMADLKDAHVRYSGMAMPIKNLHVDARLPRGGIEFALTGVNLAGENQSLVSVESVTARLAGIPAKGEPLVIEQVHVTEPHVVFASRPDGDLKGWSQLADISQTSKKPATQPSESASDTLQAIRLEQFQIDGGAVTYQPAGGEPITMDGINVALSSKPREQSPELLEVTGKIQAGPLLKADLKGELNTRTAVLNVNQFEAGMDVRPAVYDQLPPRARDWASRHHFEGKLVASADGELPLGNTSKGQFKATAELTSARMEHNGVTIPVEQALLQVAFPQRRMDASVAGLQFISEDKPFFALNKITAEFNLPANEPMVLEQLLVDKPAIRLITDANGSLLGWSRLGSGSQAGASTQPTSKDKASHGSLLVKHIKVADASVAYAANPGVEPITIEGIDLAATATAEHAEVLQVNGKIADKLVQAQLAGQLNTNNRVLQVEQFQATTTLSEDQGTLVQALPALQPYGLAGKIAVHGTGTVPLDAIGETKGQVQADLTQAGLTYKGLSIPVGQGKLEATLPDGPFSVSVGDVSVSAGKTAIAKAKTISLQGRLPAQGEPLKLDLLRMEQPAVNLVRRAQGGLVGWSNLSEPSRPGGNAQQAPTSETTSSPLSRFSPDRLEIANAEVRYEGPEFNGPLILLGLDANVRTGKTQQPDVLSFSGQVRQPDLMSIDFEGGFNAKQSLLSFSKCTAKAEINDAQLAKLPKDTRESLQRQQLQGSFAANWQGVIPLGSEAKPKGHFDLSANNARLRYAGSLIPVGTLKAQADLPNGPVAVNAEKVAIRTGDLDIFSTDRLDLKIDQLPTDQSPLRIGQLVLSSPRVLLVSQNGGFAGWSQLTGGTAQADGAPRADRQVNKSANRPGPIINRLEVQEGELVYAPAPGQAIMALPGINLRSEVEQGNPNWFSVVGQIKRGPFLEMDLRGRFNNVAQSLDLKTLHLRAELNDQQMQALPPSIQAMVREHEVRGVFTIDAQGQIPFKDPALLQGKLTASVQNAHFAYKDTSWPVQQLTLTAQADKGNVTAQANAAMLGGNLKADGQASMPQNGAFTVNWQASQLRLEQMLRAVQDQESRYSGIIDSRGQARGQFSNLPQTLAGSGELTINNGNLVHLPVFERVILTVLKLPLLGRNLERHDDRAEFAWDFRPDSLEFSKMALVSGLINLDGRGQVYYDSRLNLRLNAEPKELPRVAEKVVPRGLPGGIDRVIGGIDRIGGAIQDVGAIAGKIVTYHVEGTLSEPRVVPVPLSGLSGR